MQRRYFVWAVLFVVCVGAYATDIDDCDVMNLF